MVIQTDNRRPRSKKGIMLGTLLLCVSFQNLSLDLVFGLLIMCILSNFTYVFLIMCCSIDQSFSAYSGLCFSVSKLRCCSKLLTFSKLHKGHTFPILSPSQRVLYAIMLTHKSKTKNSCYQLFPPQTSDTGSKKKTKRTDKMFQ